MHFLEKGDGYLKKAIMVINKNPDMANKIAFNLSSSDTEIIGVFSMAEALHILVKKEFCLIILDAQISAEDDHQLLAAIRKSKTTPILILSSQSCHVERLQVLQAGAHAYIGEPYSLEECLAQAQALMQLYCELKPQPGICYTLAFGKDLVIDPLARQVLLNGKDLRLTRKEFDLLFCLASNPGQVFSRKQLYSHVWDEHAAYNVDEVIKTQIKTLRQKLSTTGNESSIFHVEDTFFVLLVTAFSYHYATAYLLYHKTISRYTQLRIRNCTNFCTIMLR